MFIEIRLCNPVNPYHFKWHVKIVEIYMVKLNVSILNRLKIMGFFVNAKYIHKHVISNKTVTKLFTILTKWVFFLYLNPANYLKTDLIEPGLSDYHALLTNVKKTHSNQASSLM